MGALDCADAEEVVATMAATPSATIEIRIDRLVEDACWYTLRIGRRGTRSDSVIKCRRDNSLAARSHFALPPCCHRSRTSRRPRPRAVRSPSLVRRDNLHRGGTIPANFTRELFQRRNEMSKLLRGVAAGYGAKKLGGGCFSTVLIFIILWWLLGHFGIFK